MQCEPLVQRVSDPLGSQLSQALSLIGIEFAGGLFNGVQRTERLECVLGKHLGPEQAYDRGTHQC